SIYPHLPILGSTTGLALMPDDDAIQILFDSLYCGHEALQILKLSGTTPAVGYSMQAYMHEKIGDWALVLKTLVSMDNAKAEELWENAEQAIGQSPKQFLAFNYHYEMALSGFHDMVNTHNEGDSYKKLIGNMYYLENDFSDPQYMFGAAIERLQINSGLIKKKIQRLKAKINCSTAIYSYDRY
ncbi:MAG: hypothetical protein ACPF9D_04665, partial [Owenweeksia sp.]